MLQPKSLYDQRPKAGRVDFFDDPANQFATVLRMRMAREGAEELSVRWQTVIEVDLGRTVAQVKQIVFILERVRPQDQSLRLADRELADAKTLQEEGVVNGAQLHVCLKPSAAGLRSGRSRGFSYY